MEVAGVSNDQSGALGRFRHGTDGVSSATPSCVCFPTIRSCLSHNATAGLYRHICAPFAGSVWVLANHAVTVGEGDRDG